MKLALLCDNQEHLTEAKLAILQVAKEQNYGVKITLFHELKKLLDSSEAFEIYIIDEPLFAQANEAIEQNETERDAKNQDEKRTYYHINVEFPFNTEIAKEILNFISPKTDSIQVSIKNGVKTVLVPSILCFENRDRKIIVHTNKGSFESTLTMKEAAALVEPYSFYSPYVSFLLNLAWAECIKGNDVVLRNGMALPLSQKRASAFRKAFKDFLSSLQK